MHSHSHTVTFFCDSDTLECHVWSGHHPARVEWSGWWRPRSYPCQFKFIYGHVISVKSFFRQSHPSRRGAVTPPPQTMPEEDALPDEIRLPIVKSMLQKCIRRKEKLAALQAAKYLLRLNARSFLRRLVIIAAEDVSPDPKDTLFLIFLFKVLDMGFKLGPPHENRLMGIVASLCESDTSITYGSEEQLLSFDAGNELAAGLHIFINSTVFFLSGDKLMLTWYHNMLLRDARWAASLQHSSTLEDPVDISQIPPLKKKDCPLYSIDFHNCPRMLLYVQQALKAVDPESKQSLEEIKEMIWDYRSSLNARKPGLPASERSQYFSEKVLPIVDRYSTQALR